MTKKIKNRNFVKTKKKRQNVEETQPTLTSNIRYHSKENKYIQPKLFNLSNTMLYKCQTSILLRGLKFTSTPKSNTFN